MQNKSSSLDRDLHEVDIALRTNPRDSLPIAERFVEKYPDNVDGLIFLARAHQVNGKFAEAMQDAERAIALSPGNSLARLLMVEAQMVCGQSEAALLGARALESDRRFDPLVLQHLGNIYRQANRYADAARCYERARVLRPVDLVILQNLASCYVALADIGKADMLLDELLRKAPHEYSAYYNRATLRKQTPERNHVKEMENLLSEGLRQEDAEHILCYSLAKELEDLKEWKRSFQYLKRGADARRRAEPYDISEDIAVLDDVARRMDRSFFSEGRPGYAGPSPIFVLGMPRSGTTLVDRILSSHSEVGSVGESGAFELARERALGADESAMADIRSVDCVSLGRAFCETVSGLLPGYSHILDKTPANFYNIGWIAAALPDAKIIHLRRDPMDNCYAIYKTLFRFGCPYSYDLEELSAYYLAYLRLMEHWREVLPGRFLDVDYEELVSDQEGVTRRLIAHCGLAWEDACLSFEKNPSPSLTASAAQVRQPIYKSSVQLWRRYKEELEPLARFLRKGGVQIS